MPSPVVWLDASLPDTSVVGGKADGLLRLVKAGFHVPPAFVVPASVDLDYAASGAILEAAAQLSAAASAPLLAVRSSAAAEDGGNGSFAGLFETFLDVFPSDVVDRVKRCRAASVSARLDAYTGQTSQAGTMAVVIQAMIPAEYAGVVFSVDPVNQDRDYALVEVVNGCGERLVGGIATPASLRIRRTDWTIDALEWGDCIDDSLGVISAIGIRAAVEAVAIERAFGYPVDVEFCFCREELSILQARPITTLGGTQARTGR